MITKLSERSRISYDEYVLKTSSKAARYTAVFFAGLGLSLSSGAIVGASIFYLGGRFDYTVMGAMGTIFGLTLLGFGYGGNRWLTDQVVDYPAWQRDTETIDTPREVSTPVDTIPVNTQKKRVDLHRVRNDKILAHGADEFVFTGQNLDKLCQWIDAGNDAIRKETSGQGYGYNDLPQPITSTRFTLARKLLLQQGMIDNEGNYTARGIMWFAQE